SDFTIRRQATSQATSSPPGTATYHQEKTPAAASAVTTTRPSRITERTLRRRRVARCAAARRAATVATTGAGPLVSMTGRDGARPGWTTSRASRDDVGSRRARTRIREENRSTERLRCVDSWCVSALGRSEERRVGKESKSRWSRNHQQDKKKINTMHNYSTTHVQDASTK